MCMFAVSWRYAKITFFLFATAKLVIFCESANF